MTINYQLQCHNFLQGILFKVIITTNGFNLIKKYFIRIYIYFTYNKYNILDCVVFFNNQLIHLI